MKPYLDAIRAISGELSQQIAAIPSVDWEGPTNCPPWTIRELATHMVTSGQGFVASVRNGLAGSTEPLTRSTLEATDPQTLARALDLVTEEFVSLYEGLADEQLETVCFHRRGNRSVRWYAAHRLAELAFHRWDLETSLGGRPILDRGVARLLLPMLLESNVPRTYAAGLSAERGRGERYLLQVPDEPDLQWTVKIDPDALSVTPGRGNVDATISAPAGALALLVYGRATLEDPRIRAEGDPEVLRRFQRVFPRP